MTFIISVAKSDRKIVSWITGFKMVVHFGWPAVTQIFHGMVLTSDIVITLPDSFEVRVSALWRRHVPAPGLNILLVKTVEPLKADFINFWRAVFVLLKKSINKLFIVAVFMNFFDPCVLYILWNQAILKEYAKLESSQPFWFKIEFILSLLFWPVATMIIRSHRSVNSSCKACQW